jgi:hypothetical protein
MGDKLMVMVVVVATSGVLQLTWDAIILCVAVTFIHTKLTFRD